MGKLSVGHQTIDGCSSQTRHPDHGGHAQEYGLWWATTHELRLCVSRLHSTLERRSELTVAPQLNQADAGFRSKSGMTELPKDVEGSAGCCGLPRSIGLIPVAQGTDCRWDG